jgi:hypothetical protein
MMYVKKPPSKKGGFFNKFLILDKIKKITYNNKKYF